jgi:hypothetical protein
MEEHRYGIAEVDLHQGIARRPAMPNQKNRKKKDGANKNKKMQAMRAKEMMAKPAAKPTATGKKPGQTSKFDLLKDRPGAMRRA